LAIAVVLHALHQRAGAITDAGNGYFDVVSQTNPPISRKNKTIETRARGKSTSSLDLPQMYYVWRSGHMGSKRLQYRRFSLIGSMFMGRAGSSGEWTYFWRPGRRDRLDLDCFRHHCSCDGI
jgi:hypothetical protein